MNKRRREMSLRDGVSTGKRLARIECAVTEKLVPVVH